MQGDENYKFMKQSGRQGDSERRHDASCRFKASRQVRVDAGEKRERKKWTKKREET